MLKKQNIFAVEYNILFFTTIYNFNSYGTLVEKVLFAVGMK